MTRPVTSRTASARPCSRQRAHRGSVRRSCQTMALAIGRPLARSHSSVVSRWLVIPMAAMSDAVNPAWASASRAVASWVSQISIGSCSTQPGCG
ncbi:hypothetical protein X551_04650 [Methylibium sp. T29]|nr:hypothetical protein X551_04650 [Methylibium sp. T29]